MSVMRQRQGGGGGGWLRSYTHKKKNLLGLVALDVLPPRITLASPARPPRHPTRTTTSAIAGPLAPRPSSSSPAMLVLLVLLMLMPCISIRIRRPVVPPGPGPSRHPAVLVPSPRATRRRWRWARAAVVAPSAALVLGGWAVIRHDSIKLPYLGDFLLSLRRISCSC